MFKKLPRACPTEVRVIHAPTTEREYYTPPRVSFGGGGGGFVDGGAFSLTLAAHEGASVNCSGSTTGIKISPG